MPPTTHQWKLSHTIARSIQALVREEERSGLQCQHLWAWCQWNVDHHGSTFPPAQDRAEIQDFKLMQRWSADRRRHRTPSQSALLDLHRYHIATSSNQNAHAIDYED
jgi:hypothetical protein